MGFLGILLKQSRKIFIYGEFNMQKFTVSQINRFIKQIFSFEEIFYGINIEGEISNFKYHKTGHMYFTLKDEKSSIYCVFFKEQADVVSFMPEDGMVVVVHGDVGVYEAYGRYQIYGISMRKVEEEGDLQKKLNMLKNKLSKEGLFNLENKKKLPQFPKKIGVVAANKGAAIEDVLKIISKRFPIVKLYVCYAIMQGKNAVKSVVRSLKLCEKKEVDIIILARGGGSKEDLEVFDDEEMVRFISGIKIPVVSAIGHENDWSIVDLVSDFRASTPSSAAASVCPDIFNILERINIYKDLFKRVLVRKIEDLEFRLKIYKKDLEFFQKERGFLKYFEIIKNFKKQLNYLIYKKYEKCYLVFEKKRVLLNSLNPENIFKKGFALILDENKKNISSVRRTKVGKVLNVCFKDGDLLVEVIKKNLR